MADSEQPIELLTEVRAGDPLLFAGNRIARVPESVAERFRPGDSLVVVQSTGDVLLIAREEREIADRAVARALEAFERLNAVSDQAISEFFERFAANLESDAIWAHVARANAADVAEAERRGRSTTRLVADETMRRKMAEGLRGWIGAASRRGQVLETVQRDGWRAELVGAALGPVGFVFEGRPNVIADATGVLRGGNPVVFRIGRDALGSARALMEHALAPALRDAGLPDGAAVLIDSPEHAAGWALFGNRSLALAVARGSGPAVDQLGALAQQAGVPVSLHGTGGAWIVAAEDADAEEFRDAVTRSLDRKVCNTLNTCCIPRARAGELVPALLDGMRTAGERLGQDYRLHVEEGDRRSVPQELFERDVTVLRAEGEVVEKQATVLDVGLLGHEWEWERTPEVTLKIVDDLDEAVRLFNRYSPQFVAGLVSSSEAAHERFYLAVNAPFVCDGHTRWVDGQVALGKPELGLSNWQWGRLFGRGGILSGDSVYTVRTRAHRD